MKSLMLGVGLIVGIMVGHGEAQLGTFDQANFPCREDEVLMYTVFDKDNVMCVHLDELKAEIVSEYLLTELAPSLPPVVLP